jgi:hypothetical protein
MRVHQPSPAERARTVLRLAPYLRLRVPGATAEVDLHGTDPDGSVVLVLPDDCRAVAAARQAGDNLPALVDAADVCPVPVPDRVRGRARLVGWVHEPPAHLRRELALVAADREGAGALLDIGSGRTVLYLQVAEVQYVDGGADPDDVAAVVPVDREDYATALPDPLAGVEASLLRHLVLDHPAELDRLAGLLPPAVWLAADRVTPVRLDRHGLLLRAAGRDVRLAFAEPLTCPRQLPARMSELLARACAAAGASARPA